MSAPTKKDAPPVKNAFAMMFAVQAGKGAKKDTPAVASGSGSQAGYVAPVFAKSTFKGSGLGAGPKHTVEAKDQPWVEK